MGKLLIASLCFFTVACAKGSETFVEDGGGGNSSQGGSPPVEGGGSEGGAPGFDCGNDITNTGEDCDGNDLEVTTCEDLGFVGGDLACSETCEFDTSGCLETLCDNGKVDEGEDCDGSELGAGSCVAEGFAGGVLSCEAKTCTFDASACKPNFTADFEGATMPTGFTGNWLLDSSTFYMGAKSAKNADIGDSQSSGMSLTLVYDAPGSITFWHRESTESSYDFLYLYVDGAQVAIYANDNWQQATQSVGAGSHTFEWRYVKDGSLSSGLDTVWVDNIQASGGYLP